jgi:hypothetical protein
MMYADLPTETEEDTEATATTFSGRKSQVGADD